jgi:hypothetical protein
MDDISTGLIYLIGLGSLETNPIARVAGYGGLLIVSIAVNIMILFFMKWLIRTYKRNYEAKGMFYKLYDVFIFLGCLIVIFLVFSKVEYGYQNYSHVIKYNTNSEYKEQLLESKEIAENMMREDPGKYNEIMDDYYGEVYSKINFFKSIFMALCAYFLMRIDYKVSPWGC